MACVVGSKQANGFGLFDMGGNITEWCIDDYSDYGTEQAGEEQRQPAHVPRIDPLLPLVFSIERPGWQASTPVLLCCGLFKQEEQAQMEL